jgi:serine/threonine protein kinase
VDSRQKGLQFEGLLQQTEHADTIFPVNQRLGKYTLLECIGEGGMGQVYRARMDGAHGFEKEVAIKRLRESVLLGESLDLQSLINEGRIGGKLQHPNVVEVFELGEHEGSLFIAMELIDGVPLSRILRNFRASSTLIPVNVALDIAAQVCRGLSYAHNYEKRYGKHNAVVHRDLKPSNIMVTTRGVTKVLDFGIARSSNSEMATTGTGMAKGTPLCMSPEHLEGVKPFPPQADIFSLGVILYELTTGKLLFGAGSIPEIIGRVQWQDLDKAIEDADRAIPGVGEILNECLNRRIEMRWVDAHEGARLLDAMARQAKQMTSTEDFVKRFIDGRYQRSGPRDDDRKTRVSGSGRVSRSSQATDVANEHTPPSYAAIPGQEEFDEEFYRRRRGKRGLLMGLLLAATLALVAGVGTYVYRATLGVSLASEEAEGLLAEGDLEGALDSWQTVLELHGGRPDARIAIAALRGRRGGGPALLAELDALLKRVSDGSLPEFVRRQRSFALLQRSFGNYKQAHGVLREAVDRLYQRQSSGAAPPPPALLWETAELSLILGREDEAKRAFQELSRTLPPSVAADAASAYVGAIDAGLSALLRMELLWIDRRLSEEWPELPGLLRGKSRLPGWMARQRAVWAQRALSEEQYKVAESIAARLDSSSKRTRYTIQAGALAGQGKENNARKALAMALSFAPTRADQAASHSQVAQAAIRGGCSAQWIDELIEQLEELVHPADPDLRYLRGLRSGQVLMLSTWAEDGSLHRELWADPRSGRFFLPGLQRGGPGSSRLLESSNFGRNNRSRGGSAWPFGPSFHPIDGTPMQQFFHPGR